MRPFQTEWEQEAAQLTRPSLLTPFQKLFFKLSHSNLKITSCKRPCPQEDEFSKKTLGISEEGLSRTGVQSAKELMEAQREVYLILSLTYPTRQGILYTECQGVAPDVTVINGVGIKPWQVFGLLVAVNLFL